MSRRALAQLAACLALALCASASSAAVGQPQVSVVSGDRAVGGSSAVLREGQIDETGVFFEVAYSWPAELRRGWFPVDVTLRNGTEEPVGLRLTAETNWGREDRVTKRLALAEGETASFELLLRARGNGVNQYVFTLEARGEEVQVSGCSPTEMNHGTARDVLYVSRAQAAAGSEERWSEEWADAADSGHFGFHSGGLRVTPRTFDQLSANWQAYTSLDSVVLDLAGGLPAAEDLAALLAWCRAGGTLHALGRPLAELREVAAFAPYLEPRFEVRLAESPHSVQRGLHAFACGFGNLVVQDALEPGRGVMETEGAEPALAFFADRAQLRPSWTRPSFGRVSRQQLAEGTLSEFESLPLRALMLLLIGFAIVMGPVNFLWVRRTKKPLLLLATVPGIAIVTSLALLAYGVLSQGLDIKVMTKSWAVVDQRSQDSTTAEVRQFFAGSSPGEGLRPEAGTAVVPEERFWSGSWRTENLFTCDYTEGRLLGGDYAPVRRPVGQLVLSDRPTRLRLEARRVGDEVEVTNALGAALEEVVLRTPDGEYHFLEEPVEPGAAGTLTWSGASARGAEVMQELVWIRSGEEGRLAPGTYVARLAAAPLRDDLGIELNELEGAHYVLGILDADEETWR